VAAEVGLLGGSFRGETKTMHEKLMPFSFAIN